MPNFEEHCESTGKKLGCRFERIHKWMDSPSRYMGTTHRLRRHDPHKTPEIARELFSKYYPNHAHLIEEAVLDHVELDRNSSGDFTYSKAEKMLRQLDEEEKEKAWRKGIEKESRLKSLRGIPMWLALSLGSIIATYLSYQSDPTNSHPLIAIFFLASVVFLFLTFGFIGEYLGFEPFTFSLLTFMEIGVVIFLVLFSVNNLSLMLFGMFTGFYLLMTIGKIVLGRRLEEHTQKLNIGIRKMLEEERRMELGEPEQEEEPDFLSEENLEAQGIPSSAVMDLEDIEE